MCSQFWIRSRESDKARKQGHLACGSSAACEVPVESVPQAVFKSPAEYVATVIITFTVLHSQFRIIVITVIITVLDYSDYYSFGLQFTLHLQFWITVIITVSDYSDYIVIITVVHSQFYIHSFGFTVITL